MSLESLSAGRIRGAASVGQPLLELRKSQAALAVLVARLFEDLERRRRQLDRDARELRTARVEFERATAAAQTRGAQQTTDHGDEESVKRVLLARLSDASADLAELRAQLTALRAELAVARGAADGQDSAPGQQQLNQLELERRTLQAELDAARRHTADLEAQLTECRRRFDEDRSEWNGELRQLLRLLERQSQTLEERLAQALDDPGSPHSAQAAGAGDEHHGPALGAALAHFGQLPGDLSALAPVVLTTVEVPGELTR